MLESIALVALLVAFGYLLGIVGFFRAGAAKAEIRELRALLAEEVARRTEAQAPTPQQDPSRQTRPEPETPLSETSLPETPEPAPEVPPAAATPPEPSPTAPVAAAPRPGARDLESVLTMRWAAWGGAVALLLAGVFLIRYATEQGLLGPATRCAAAALLGVALLAAAEWLRRRDVPTVEGAFAVDQAPPALAAGGIAVLFGAAYGAGPFYDLLAPVAAFVLMAATSFVGMAAALRFGPLTAAVGIVGAFVAPALVQTASPSLIGLFAYLALATVAAYEIVWRTAWVWLGFAVAIAGAIWVLVAAAMAPDPQLWAAAAYVPVAAFLGLLLPEAAVEDRQGRMLAFGQLTIVAMAGFTLEAAAPDAATRLALLALTPLAVWKGIEAPRLDRLPWLAAAAGLGALLFWDGAGTAWVAPAVGASTFLLAAFAFAILQASLGLVLERRAPEAVHWSALPAAVPVLTLALAYARVGRLAPDPTWGLAGLLLAFGLVATARRAVVAEARPSAGAHAAGAVAALALAFAMTLRDAWLTDALALILPGLAWIEGKVELPALRKVALVVAGVTFVLLWRWLADAVWSPGGALPAGAFATYAIPALAFFAASRLFRARRDDAAVATLEAGAIGLGALYVTLQIRMWFGHGRLDAPFGFDEAATVMLAAAAQAFAYDVIAMRAPRPAVAVARALLVAVAGLLAVALLLANPMITGAPVTTVSLLIAYLVPGLVAGAASLAPRRRPVRAGILGGYAVVAGFAWTTLEVRHAFHPEAMPIGPAPVLDAELWGWSGAWLVYGLVLMVLGIRLRVQPLRLAALGLIGLVCGKVFLWDMADLTGLWRVASFLGLGLALIGLAAMHRRFVLPRQAEGAA